MPGRTSTIPLQRSFLLSLLLLPSVSVAFNISKAMDPEDRSGTWSIGAYFNWQESPYAGEEWRSDFMPQFVYTGENVYLDTTQLGWHAIDNDD